MSRARIVCSEILSRMSPVHNFEDKVYPNLNTSQDKVFNLCFNECSNGDNTDVSTVLSEINTSMDDWLRQKTTCTSMDCIDSAYLNDINFLSTRDPDMCSSDVGLELILVDEKKEINLNCTINEKNSDLDYTDPLLNLEPMSEVLLRKTETKCDNLLSGKDLYASDGETNLNKSRLVWDTLSTASRKSDCDVENNNDFADFNLLPFSFDTSINALDPQTETYIHSKQKTPTQPDMLVSFVNDSIVTASPSSHNKKVVSIKRPNILRTAKHRASKKTIEKNININVNMINESVFEPEILTLLPEELDGPMTLSLTISNEAEERKKHNVSLNKMTGCVAIVSNMCAMGKTRIVIKTAEGVEQYEGNTVELTEPVGRNLRPSTPVEGEHIVTSVRTAATLAVAPASERDDRLVRDILAMQGISDNMLYSIATNRGMRLWVCPEHECRRIFNRLSTLKAHILSHYGLKPFRCDFPKCPWSFYTSFKLKRHRETHLKRKDFTCTVADCNRSFTTVYNLNTHLKLHERPARLKCLVRSCSARFQTRRAMEMHLKTHERALAPYKCAAPGCSKLYFSLGALTAHMRCHQYKEEELRCQWENCGRRFDKPCRLKAHMRMHTGDKPYVCRYQDCHWAFASSSKLKRHQFKHNNERRFRCTIGDCNKAFMRSEHLREHTFTHIAQRTFQCPTCGEKCSAKATLYVHKKKFHPTETKKQLQVKTNTAYLIPNPVVIQDIDGKEYEVNLNKPVVTTTNTITCNKRKAKTKIIKSCARTYLPYIDKTTGTTGTAKAAISKAAATTKAIVLDNCNGTEHQTVYLNNVMLQDNNDATEAVTDDMYTQEDGAEYILLFDSGTNSTFPESTVNLKDLD